MLSARIKELRQKRGISQLGLAQQVGFSQQAIAKWETDKATPSPETLASMSEFFDVSVDYLIGTTNNPTPPDRKKAAYSGITPSEAAKAYFKAEKGREPTEDELRIFLATAQGLFSTLPDKTD
jgi:transcriptional regulator with XRE-family HTH domain